jgi:cytochrome c oxidase subunit II
MSVPPGSPGAAATARMIAAARRLAPASLAYALVACSGQQSALQPSGTGAREAAILWWIMFAGAVLIFALVLALLLYAVLQPPERRRPVSVDHMVVGGGIALPVVALSILLTFGLPMGASTYADLPPDAPRVRVQGQQWWWEIEYVGNDGAESFATANEIYLPVGQPVELLLTSRDVIHSLWIPRIAGKQDLIPGRTNRLVVEAQEPGVFRAQCAEFCGLAHTQMALYVVAAPPEEFEAWTERQRAPAELPQTAAEARGAAAFVSNGCALCHAIRGQNAWGEVGPDLTHVGSRLTIGAGLVANTADNIATWIACNHEMKPGNQMPSYLHLDGETLHALGAYLESLQ